MILGDGRAARSRVATAAWYDRTYSFAIYCSLLGLLLLDIVGEVREGLCTSQSHMAPPDCTLVLLSPVRLSAAPVGFASYVQP